MSSDLPPFSAAKCVLSGHPVPPELYPRRGRWEKDSASTDTHLAIHRVHARRAGEVPYSASVWRLGGILAISSWQMSNAPDGSGEVIPQWLISVSDSGHRPSDRVVAKVRADFGMEDADVDNHHPGVAMHLWMPVEKSRRKACHCKEPEAIVREPDGYEWANDLDLSACRGCEYGRAFGKPCPVHGARVTS